jgi:hypothetical protein
LHTKPTRSDITFLERQDRGVPPVLLSRRAFLAASGGVVLAAACGGSSDGGGSGNQELSALLLASDLYASPDPQRIAFALADGGDFASGPPAKLAFGAQGRSLGRPVGTELHTRGLPRRRGIYTADVTLPQAGAYLGVVEVSGRGDASLAFQVQETAKAPVPGQPAPRAVSPTVADPLGVDPLCTRNPPCPLHETSLDTLIGAGKPVAVMLATPARCESRYCGPVLDDLLTLVDEYRDRVAVVHVEIYKSLEGSDLVPTVEAWGIQTEPWLFGVDASGNIAARLDGAFGHDEQRRLLQELVS